MKMTMLDGAPPKGIFKTRSCQWQGKCCEASRAIIICFIFVLLHESYKSCKYKVAAINNVNIVLERENNRLTYTTLDMWSLTNVLF